MPEYDTTVPAGHGDAGTVTGDPGGTDVGGAGEERVDAGVVVETTRVVVIVEVVGGAVPDPRCGGPDRASSTPPTITAAPSDTNATRSHRRMSRTLRHRAALGARRGNGRRAGRVPRVALTGLAPLAQSAEHFHGKEGVYGSSP